MFLGQMSNSTGILAALVLLFGLCDVSGPLAVAEMLKALTGELLELRWGLVCLG